MLHYRQLEFLTNERQKMFMEEAEQHRLEKIVSAQPDAPQRLFPRLSHWVGAHLVRWGLQLQGEKNLGLHFHPTPSTHR